MELLSRRRWRLISAHLSNKFGYCPLYTVSIVLQVHKHNSLPLGQIRAFISRKLLCSLVRSITRWTETSSERIPASKVFYSDSFFVQIWSKILPSTSALQNGAVTSSETKFYRLSSSFILSYFHLVANFRLLSFHGFVLAVIPRLWVKADCWKCHLFISTKHPPLTPIMKPCDVSYL